MHSLPTRDKSQIWEINNFQTRNNVVTTSETLHGQHTAPEIPILLIPLSTYCVNRLDSEIKHLRKQHKQINKK